MAFSHSNSRHGQLSINSVSLMTPATRILNLQEIWSRSNRGASKVIPHADGRKGRRRRRDEIAVSLQLIVGGDVSMAGVAASNRLAQLDTTMAYLEAQIVTPPSDPDGYPSVLTLRTGATLTADVVIETWDVEPHPNRSAMNVVTFDLAIPSGRYA